jgi:hypothetical protein
VHEEKTAQDQHIVAVKTGRNVDLKEKINLTQSKSSVSANSPNKSWERMFLQAA